MAYDKKALHKGSHVADDDEAFLRVDRDPWTASASGHGYSSRYNDDTGHIRGSNHDDSDSHGLVNRLPDEAVDSVHGSLYGLIDNDRSWPDGGEAGKWVGGGGPVSENKHGGVGDGPPRYAPKSGPLTNARRK